MTTTLNQQMKQDLNQYRLEVQNQELQAQVLQANHIIEMQNQHIEHIFSSINVLIGIMGIVVAIFGIVIPLWNAWKSTQMKKDVELAVEDANSFVTNKFKEWEECEAKNAIKKYINNEISWQDLHSILKYKPLTPKQLLEIYNAAIIADNKNMIECLTNYIFNEHYTDKSEGYNKVRNLIVDSKYFPQFASKLTPDIVNALLSVSDKKRENIINQIIDLSASSFLSCNHIDEKIALSSNNKNHIVDKIIQEKSSSALRILENNKEFIDLLIKNGLFKDCSIKGNEYYFGMANLSLQPNSYLKQKLEQYFLNEVTKRMKK